MASASPTADKKVWHHDEIISFIQAYESLPVLWDSNCEGYKSKDKKIHALKKLAETYNTSLDEVRRKIHNLRCQFNGQLRKIKKKSLEHGIDENLIYSEWKYFDNIKFLAGVSSGPDKKPKTDILLLSLSEDESDEDLGDSFAPENSDTKIPKTEKVYVTSETTSTFNRSMVNDVDNRIFGEYVASELRNLSDRNAKKLKLMIRKAIVEVTEDEFNLENSIGANM